MLIGHHAITHIIWIKQRLPITNRLRHLNFFHSSKLRNYHKIIHLCVSKCLISWRKCIIDKRNKIQENNVTLFKNINKSMFLWIVSRSILKDWIKHKFLCLLSRIELIDPTKRRLILRKIKLFYYNRTTLIKKLNK
jgi:hypothetical protein